METIIEKLKNYFENTPEEKIQEGWDRTKEYDDYGTTVDEIEKHMTMKKCKIVERINQLSNGECCCNCENQYEYVDNDGNHKGYMCLQQFGGERPTVRKISKHGFCGELYEERKVVKDHCPECGYPLFKNSFEDFYRCHGCNYTTKTI